MYIDKLSQAVLENALRAGKKRWFIGAQTGVNKEQFLDWNKDFVDVEGSANLDDAHMREITTTPLPGSTLNLLQMKVDELKETSSNRDVSSGGTMGGVTAASAITALQEAGNKTSRDMISASYRAYTQLDYLIIELVRQFYDQERSFRIVKADLLRPNAISEGEKVAWCLELERQLEHEFYPRYVQSTPPPEGEEGEETATKPTGRETVLSGSGPYEEMYVYYVASKVDLASQEMETYTVDAALLRAAMDDFRKDYHRTHVPR